jgi:hypothetical protein
MQFPSLAASEFSAAQGALATQLGGILTKLTTLQTADCYARSILFAVLPRPGKSRRDAAGEKIFVTFRKNSVIVRTWHNPALALTGVSDAILAEARADHLRQFYGIVERPFLRLVVDNAALRS